jgi:hypothetical protein
VKDSIISVAFNEERIPPSNLTASSAGDQAIKLFYIHLLGAALQRMPYS